MVSTNTHIQTPNPALRVRKQRPDSSCLNPDLLAQTIQHTHTHTHRHTHTDTEALITVESSYHLHFECPAGSEFISSSASLHCSFVWLRVSGCVHVCACMCMCVCVRMCSLGVTLQSHSLWIHCSTSTTAELIRELSCIV